MCVNVKISTVAFFTILSCFAIPCFYNANGLSQVPMRITLAMKDLNTEVPS